MYLCAYVIDINKVYVSFFISMVCVCVILYGVHSNRVCACDAVR